MQTDHALVEALLAADEEAVAHMVETYGDRLFKTALAITGDVHHAEEVVQDAFLKAYDNIRTFRAESSFYTWLLRIAVNIARTRRKRLWLVRSVPLERYEQQLSDVADPEASMIRHEERRQVLECLAHLPERYREVLALFYLEDMSVAQIAAMLAQPEGTIKSKLSRARAMLKARVEQCGVIR